LGLCTIDQQFKNKFKDLNIPTIKKFQRTCYRTYTQPLILWEKNSTIATHNCYIMNVLKNPKLGGSLILSIFENKELEVTSNSKNHATLVPNIQASIIKSLAIKQH
jgi:hypothetical protein